MATGDQSARPVAPFAVLPQRQLHQLGQPGTESRSEASPAADGEPTGEVQPVAPGEEVAGRSQEAPEAVAQPDAVEDEPVVDEPVVDEPPSLESSGRRHSGRARADGWRGAAPGLPEPRPGRGAQVEQATDGEAQPPTPPAEANEVQAAVRRAPEHRSRRSPSKRSPSKTVVVPSMDTDEPSAGEPPETGEQELETGEPPQAEAEPQVPGTGVTSAAGALRASEP